MAIIKSIQSGVTSFSPSDLSVSITISAVNSSKTRLVYRGVRASSNLGTLGYLTLSSNTKLVVYRKAGTSGTSQISWQVIEYN